MQTNITVSNISSKNLYIRFEKIAAAFYLVTNHLSDEDPLKISIRQKTIALLDMVNELNTDTFVNSLFKKDKIKNVCEQVISLLHMAVQAGLVTRINVDIISAENKKVQNFLASLFEETIASSGQASLFYVDENMTSFTTHGEQKQYIGHGHEFTNDMSIKKTEKQIGNTKNKKDNMVSGTESEKDLKPRKKNRRDFILGIIGQKGEVTIKDISNVFNGCSEKTIQRELISLVSEGVVSKEGERRWSKYKLARI